jgi:hypothetical protein
MSQIPRTVNNQYANAKSITPIQVRLGKPQATKLNVVSTNDNLSTSAVFSYVLVGADNNAIDSGSIVISGQDYQNWTGDNSTPYTYVAGKIGVTLV